MNAFMHDTTNIICNIQNKDQLNGFAVAMSHSYGLYIQPIVSVDDYSDLLSAALNVHGFDSEAEFVFESLLKKSKELL